MKPLYYLSFAALLTACAINPVDQSTNCSAVGPCVSIGNIAVFAEDNIGNPILRSAQEGAVSFQRYFGSENVPIAIVPGGEITPDMDEKLKAAGFEWSLPWMSATDKESMVESRIRKQVMEQTKGMPPEQQESIIKMALAKADMTKSGNGASAAGDMSAIEQGALTHELGHMWFMAAFKPANEDIGNEHGYGGWAPDWLDETAAVLLENKTLTDSRRKAFKDMPPTDFYPLEDFLTMEHPALKSALALNEKFGGETDSEGSRAIILTGEEAEAFLKASGDPTNFYTQVRGFADYVIKATGDEQIFAKLALHLSQEGSLESWLSQTQGLQDNLKGLSEGWNAYIAMR